MIAANQKMKNLVRKEKKLHKKIKEDFKKISQKIKDDIGKAQQSKFAL